MNIDCKISVVIPAYNREKTIEYCLESVLQQTVMPYEIIVVDDCSTDETKDIVEKMSESNHIIKYICLEKNSGAQAARNKGIKEARGNWIAFLDSDDQWVKNKLEYQIEELKRVNYNPMTVVHGNCILYFCDVNKKNVWELPILEGEGAYIKLLQAPSPAFPNILTSKEALIKIRYLDENVPSYQEWDTSIRLAKCCTFIHVKKPLFIYYLHSGETISKSKQREIEGYQYIIDKFHDEIIKECGSDVWEKHLKIQLRKCISFGFWDRAKIYLKEVKGYSFINRKILEFVLKTEGKGQVLLRIYDSVQKNGVIGFGKILFKKFFRER